MVLEKCKINVPNIKSSIFYTRIIFKNYKMWKVDGLNIIVNNFQYIIDPYFPNLLLPIIQSCDYWLLSVFLNT